VSDSPSKYSSGSSLKPTLGSISYIDTRGVKNLACETTQMFTMANRLSNPLTLVGTLENFWSNASDILWAGSVDMIRTVSRTLDSCTARLELQHNYKKF